MICYDRWFARRRACTAESVGTLPIACFARGGQVVLPVSTRRASELGAMKRSQQKKRSNATCARTQSAGQRAGTRTSGRSLEIAPENKRGIPTLALGGSSSAGGSPARQKGRFSPRKGATEGIHRTEPGACRTPDWLRRKAPNLTQGARMLRIEDSLNAGTPRFLRS